MSYIKKTDSRTLTKEEWLYIAENYDTSGVAELAEKLNCKQTSVYHVVYFLRKGGVKVGGTPRRKREMKVEFVKQNLKGQ